MLNPHHISLAQTIKSWVEDPPVDGDTSNDYEEPDLNWGDYKEEAKFSPSLRRWRILILEDAYKRIHFSIKLVV